MVVSPWLSYRTPQPDREYVAILSYLPLRRFRSMVRFQRYVGRIRRQLETADGLLGYSLQAKFLSRRFWTLSVWEDDASLMAFVVAPPHREAMDAMRPAMGPTNFVRWRVRGSEIPVSWDDAHRREEASASG